MTLPAGTHLGPYEIVAPLGAGVTIPPPGCTPEQFVACDITGDGDVDLGDFHEFSVSFTG